MIVQQKEIRKSKDNNDVEPYTKGVMRFWLSHNTVEVVEVVKVIEVIEAIETVELVEVVKADEIDKSVEIDEE